jgi:uncharacterized delta-60 repeat protein
VLGVIAVALSLLATPAVAAPRLDARFGDGGVARVPLNFRVGGELYPALRPVRQPDGKVLVPAPFARFAGGSGSVSQVVMTRFARRGALDEMFGRRGHVRIAFRWDFRPLTVSVQANGRILLVGTLGGLNYFSWTRMQLALIRLMPDGSRDRSFGTNGFVAWNPAGRAANSWVDVSSGLALPQPDGRLLVAANVDERTASLPRELMSQRVVFVRFNENGSVDESFGQAGLVEHPDDPNLLATTWAALPDGHLVALAPRREGGWLLRRFTPDGALDSEFGQDGSVRLDTNALDFSFLELVAGRDGSLVLIGNDALHARAVPIRRIRPDGQLDPSFGTACRRSRPRAHVWGGAATPSGGVFVTATMFDNEPIPPDSFFIRYDRRGCVADRPLRLKAVTPGPPLLQGRRMAIIGAIYYYKGRSDPPRAGGWPSSGYAANDQQPDGTPETKPCVPVAGSDRGLMRVLEAAELRH